MLARTAILWMNYPNNPTAATAPLELYERAAALAREHDFVLASDEAYSEIYFGDPPVSALQVADRTNVAVFNTLSKRSSMPGYRTGFVAGDPDLIAALKRYRPNVGVAPPEFVQRAAAAAWGDEAHVDAVRGLYRAKRDVLTPALAARGLRHAGGDATFFLWLEGAGPGLHEELLQQGDRRSRPATTSAPAGAGYLRMALVPTLGAVRACRGATGWRVGRRSARPRCRCAASASTAPVCELRRNSRPFAPLSSRALTTSPSGSFTSVPDGQVQPGLDHAVVAERDPDAGVGAEQAALPDRDHRACRRPTACPGSTRRHRCPTRRRRRRRR